MLPMVKALGTMEARRMAPFRCLAGAAGRAVAGAEKAATRDTSMLIGCVGSDSMK